MKRTLTIMASVLLGAVANAEVINATLPDSANLTQTSPMAGMHEANTLENLMNNVAGRDAGVYAGGNNNTLGNWGTNGEGTWTCTTASDGTTTGSITLCGRSGVAGDSFALVQAPAIDVTTPAQVTSVTLSFTSPTSVISGYTMFVGVVDADGTVLSQSQDYTVSSDATTTTVTWNGSVDWQEGCKIIAGAYCGGGSATQAYTISDIKLAYTVTPEPTTATLSLLALAGLCARRRRK